jgi:hypothetical protein
MISIKILNMKRILFLLPAMFFMIMTIGLTGCNKDKTAPVITLNGSAGVVCCNGSAYTDQGATATDDVDGDLTSQITVNNTVNANANGTYTVTYNVTDKAGNAAEEVTRTVTVINCK